MQITPAIKGQLTKAVKAANGSDFSPRAYVKMIFERHMPREQAKHAARKYLATAR